MQTDEERHVTASFNFVGQGWPQLGELAFAFVLSAAVGLEREVRQKSAGLRTYSLAECRPLCSC